MQPRPKVAVIIPFFQRESGILVRAVRSVFGQEGPLELHVIVVDDASPIGAAQELAGTEPAAPHALHIVKRANGGPGAARNTGLAFAAELQPDIIAFLDSDDIWLPFHAARGARELAEGADFYFSNHLRGSAAGGAADDLDWFSENCPALTSAAEKIRDLEAGAIWGMKPPAAMNTLARVYASQTSTVMARFDLIGHKRFKPELRWAGEDYFLWVELAEQARLVAFSDVPSVECGRGLNVYYGKQNWSHPDAEVPRGYSGILYRAILKSFSLEPDTRAALQERARRFFSVYAYLAAKKLITRGQMDLSLAAAIARKDAGELLLAPYRAARMALLAPQRRARYADMRGV